MVMGGEDSVGKRTSGVETAGMSKRVRSSPGDGSSSSPAPSKDTMGLWNIVKRPRNLFFFG